MEAKRYAWAADERGWPVDPGRPVSGSAAAVHPTADTLDAASKSGHSFESYVWDVWWPTLTQTLEDKNRLGHRRNAEVAVELVRYPPGDPRVGSTHNAGDSIALHHLVADDLKSAVVERRGINGRTAAVNQRRLTAALSTAGDVVDVVSLPEFASPATVRAFATTLGMIVKAAAASQQVAGDPMAGVMALAPKPRPQRLSARLVPTIEEVFDLADAIAILGSRMKDGRPTGERFRSLILAAGSLGPRPGELVAHQPEWLYCAGPSLVRFQETEAAVYDTKEGSTGRRDRPLKHRAEGEHRDVPVLPEVAEVLLLHVERGYCNGQRTWLSPTGRGHLDWGNLTDTYWRPALEKVFGGTSKAALVNASPKVLRKAAITWWLERGVSPAVAAEWAGHTEEVMQIYYASRSSTTWAAEADMLLSGRASSR
ncbi:site-specific integrase [Nocardioides glacieisoli]|uniref:Site-specific integrase n=1 Tax=Nocardioides glacieisoli TaxID=1168730 RepID=A0A4Q2RQE4_9ACTN|nr:site-specific integrase [Nocardioides glacieisoli]RYB90074.1 site-specific integrase [Nocardioides glacieisoli]